MSKSQLGRIGLWSMELRYGDKHEAAEAAAEIEDLGFGTLWIPGGIDDAVLSDVTALLSATRHMTVATGILNIWKHAPKDVAAWFDALAVSEKKRVMLGLGVSHGAIIGDAWNKPLAAIEAFLDGLDDSGMPRDNLCLAALGPKMLALAGNRTAGAHPYLVTPEHTSSARKILGADKLLAPEQGVILESDPRKARELAREALKLYATLPNYTNNWLRLGFSRQEVDDISDGLVDALFAWGGMEKIVERVKAHHDAGADHVCLQVIHSDGISGLRSACRELAGALI